MTPILFAIEMMEMEFNPWWPIYNPIDSQLEEVALCLAEMDAQVSSFEFSTSSVSIEDFSDVSSSSALLSSTLYGSQTHGYPFSGNHLLGILPREQCLPSVDEGDAPSNDQFLLDGGENFSEWMASDSSISSQQIFTEDVGSQNLSPISREVSVDVPSIQASLVLPAEYVEVDDQLVILHLLKAYGDAMGSEQMELAEEIIRRLKDKASPTGNSLERLAFYLAVALDKQANYLGQESSKNYEAAFMAFYQIFPYGRFAHFTANSAILEAIPADATAVHIVDFEIGNGIQWPPLIEALGRKGLRMLRLTSIKWGEEDGSCNPTTFEETKKQLWRHAMNFGLRLEVEEMDIEGLVSEIKKARVRGRKSEWLAFNCMVGLPHMGKGRSVVHVEHFLKTAKALISNEGVIAFGNGIGAEKWIEYRSFSSFFEGQMVYCHALLDSMEQFQLLEARIAMECLFVVPHLSSLSNAQEWEETVRECGSLSELGFEPQRLSRENYLEARELVSEGESSYWVRTDGEDNNQMVLGYMGAPLARAWRTP
ncbi:Transcription factor GRAS - like 10 [Theobroma cacao]|nr:Transcription factor GRAS - like 10 [Theobroma cacao]